jgi:isopentenyl-diphosphate delta-isomerase
LWKQIRDERPNLVLLSNIGVSQLIEADPMQILALASSIGAQGIVIHLNALQEALQPEGTPHFKGAIEALELLIESSELPVILKETGCGFSKSTLKKISKLGVKAVDLSGLGGTHWGRIEGSRASTNLGAESLQAQASKTFAEWGIPTVETVIAAQKVLPETVEIWGSGGVRSGLDAAKLIALGAHRVGYAKPALEATLLGYEKLNQWMALQEYELRVALFCTGSADPKELREKEKSWTTNDI